MIRATFVSACIAVYVTLAHGQSRPDQTRELARQAGERIKELQSEADRLALQTRTLLTELRGLELQRQIKAQEVTKADAELKELTLALEQTSTRVGKLEAERLVETPLVRERLVELYKRGQGGYVRLLMAADDLRAFGRMSRGVAAVTRLTRARLEGHRRLIRDERAALDELEKRRTDVENAHVAAVKARQALEQAVLAHNLRLDELDRRRDVAARYIGDLQTAQAELQRTVTNLGGTAVALPIAPFRGLLEWPVTGKLLTRFGRSTAGRYGTAIVRNGIDIAVPEGTLVRAVHGGNVAYAAPFTGYGTLVILDHGQNAFTLYGHLSEALVASGVRLARGAAVGRAGRTPDGAPAAYFELRIDGRPVDPVQWLRSTR